MSNSLIKEKKRMEHPITARGSLREIGKCRGRGNGPTLVLVAGMHGNEPSSVEALNVLLEQLEGMEDGIRGNVYAINGNMSALKKGVRFVDVDLNRIWNRKRVQSLRDGSFRATSVEEFEQVELWDTLNAILRENAPPFYFIDLHSTSSQTIPFMVINDSMLNRRFTMQFGLPTILGIEEYLEGPLLSYINELGYVAFGFEGGQHRDPSTVAHHLAFARLTLVYTEMVDEDAWDVREDKRLLQRAAHGLSGFFEIFDDHRLLPNELFRMHDGYENFQRIAKGETLALSNGKPVVAASTSRIFMPLYQAQGDEGFFRIRRVPKVFLQLSARLRSRKVHRWLTLLPGVSFSREHEDTLIVDQRVARFMAKQLFHLLGFRSRQSDERTITLTNRETRARNRDYAHTTWNRRDGVWILLASLVGYV